MRVGVRELKNRASEILRQVRENRAAEAAVPGREVAAELERMRQEIDRSWKLDDSAVELVNEQRP